jgi:hypothetical protein
MTAGADKTGTHWGSVVWGYNKSAGVNPPNGNLEKSLNYPIVTKVTKM